MAGVPTKLPGDPLQADVGADDGMLLPWLDAGEKLRLWLFTTTDQDDRPLALSADLTVCSHSHGLQVLAFCAAMGQPFRRAISVSGPVRRDMQRARRKALGSIRDGWVQFADPTGMDTTIVEGEMFDGEVGAHFELPEGRTIATPRSGHSGLLNDPALRRLFRFWEEVA